MFCTFSYKGENNLIDLLAEMLRNFSSCHVSLETLERSCFYQNGVDEVINPCKQ